MLVTKISYLWNARTYYVQNHFDKNNFDKWWFTWNKQKSKVWTEKFDSIANLS